MITDLITTCLLTILLVSCGSISQLSTQSIPSPTSGASLLEGTVLKVDDTTFHIKTNGQEITLVFSEKTMTWDGITWIAKIPIEMGDFVTAWGTWKSDNSFAVEKLYVNIVNLQGTVSGIIQNQDRTTFSLTNQNQVVNKVVISPLTMMYQINGSSQSTYQENRLFPKNGDNVEIIGRRLSDGSILAASISLP